MAAIPDSSPISVNSGIFKLLDFSLTLGAALLVSGAEIHRVEDTIERVCLACGAQKVEAFAILSLITVTVTMPSGEGASQSRRVGESSNNLEKIEELNTVSRRLCADKITFNEAVKELNDIESRKPARRWLVYLGAAIGAGGFTVFFGGDLLDCIVSAILGVVIYAISDLMPKSLNTMVKVANTAFIAGVLTLLLVRTGLNISVDKIMIGEVMLLIPGLSWGNALRELLTGDTISGLLRLIQSVLLAIMIAFGFAVAFLVLGGGV